MYSFHLCRQIYLCNVNYKTIIKYLDDLSHLKKKGCERMNEIDKKKQSKDHALSVGDIINRKIKRYVKAYADGITREIPCAYTIKDMSDGTRDNRPIIFENDYEIFLFDQNRNPIHYDKLGSMRITEVAESYYIAHLYVETIINKRYLSQHIEKFPDEDENEIQPNNNMDKTPTPPFSGYLYAKLNPARLTYGIDTIVEYDGQKYRLFIPESLKSMCKEAGISEVDYSHLNKIIRNRVDNAQRML